MPRAYAHTHARQAGWRPPRTTRDRSGRERLPLLPVRGQSCITDFMANSNTIPPTAQYLPDPEYHNWTLLVRKVEEKDPLFVEYLLNAQDTWVFGTKYRWLLKRAHELYLVRDPVRYGLPPAMLSIPDVRFWGVISRRSNTPSWSRRLELRAGLRCSEAFNKPEAGIVGNKPEAPPPCRLEGQWQAETSKSHTSSYCSRLRWLFMRKS
jgi:hypothetical protein